MNKANANLKDMDIEDTTSPSEDISLRDVSLTDKYELEDGTAFMSGLQALTRIAIVQRRRDIANGLNTAGFISGYRGSPLGNFDSELMRAKSYLDDLNVKIHPGVNEDLAATSVWGTQQVNLMPGGSDYDGVFGIWYGKSPGVDRSGDVMRHANAYGTAPKGGVLAIVGDDHACKSSTLPCQSDHALYAMMIPTLYPASINEFVKYGLLGIEMSRYSGCWSALKVTSENVESSGTVDLTKENVEIEHPTEEEFKMPEGGVHISLNVIPREVDYKLQNYKLFACHAFARKNKIDETVIDSPKPRFGIITAGKSYGDVRQALVELGITDEIAAQIGLKLYKVGMTWPLEPQGVQEFSRGLEEILIVEEKREMIEYQLKQQIFNWPSEERPVVVGKYDEHDERLLPLHNDQSVGMVAHVIAKRLAHFYRNEKIEARLKFFEEREKEMQGYVPPSLRRPYYCAGCPHNTSTKVPEGSFATVGIGCHYMVQWMDRSSALCTHMGGEGVPWVGSAPYTKKEHIFANLGDGTYFHSGSLAIRAAVAGNVNITYKILYNDAVAMTGGQPVDGEMPVYRVAQQVMSEGVSKAWILTETLENYKDRSQIPREVKILHRDYLPQIMKECQETEGTTVIIYDQTCAAEKRRRRKRGLYPDPPKRIIINEAVCEGCGDCSVQSNCVAVQPVETEYGRKRKINQSMCNKDFSCLKGFCPSFVSIEGGKLRKDKANDDENGIEGILKGVPEPDILQIESAYNIMVTGIGGTGVTTVGALLGMAAHMEGKYCRNLDSTGLAQKGGEVLSHVRISPVRDDLKTGHIITGGTDLLLACDVVSAVGGTAYETLHPERTRAIVNTNQTPVADFVTNNALDFHEQQIRKTLMEATLEGERHFISATSATLHLLGDEISTNIFMMGFAWQKGLIPLSRKSIEAAVKLNGVAIEMNLQAFAYGRLAAHDPDKFEKIAGQGEEALKKLSLDDMIAKRSDYLVSYQNESYAKRYKDMVERVRQVEGERIKRGAEILTETVARNYHKLLAYKDEYEVARLYTDGNFVKNVKAQFEGDYKIKFHMAPPIFSAKADPATGRPQKRELGRWMLPVLSGLSHLKILRGTMFDIFGYHHDRKMERDLIKSYEADIERVLENLTPKNYDLCAEILSLPQMIAGYGPIKEENVKRAQVRHAELIAQL
ncbi:MAG: indolepyruvate ferredoxin oxidoreductase family protein [Alphaproteobacteria bacterium]|nr:indolepyruvate ferredoxin oxidoreductase family protein [Alphaproteobacteria bacterium]